MVLTLSWSMTAWGSPRTAFGWLTFAPAAGRRAPADRSQILDAQRTAMDQGILRQNETVCLSRQGRRARRAGSRRIGSKECPTLRCRSAGRHSGAKTATKAPAKIYGKPGRYKAQRWLSMKLKKSKDSLPGSSASASQPTQYHSKCDFSGKSLRTSSMRVSGIWLFSTKPWAPQRRHSSRRANPLNWE